MSAAYAGVHQCVVLAGCPVYFFVTAIAEVIQLQFGIENQKKSVIPGRITDRIINYFTA